MAKTREDACAASTKNYKTPKTNQRTDMIRLLHTLLSVFLVHGGKSGSSPLIFNPVFFSSQPDWNRAFLTEEIPGVICLSLLSHTAQRGSMPAAGAGPRQLKEVKHTTTTGWARASSPLPSFPRGNPSTCSHRPPAKHCQIDTRKVSFVGKSLRGKRRCRDTGEMGDSFGTAWSSAFAK